MPKHFNISSFSPLLDNTLFQADKLEEIIFNSSIREKNYFDYDFIKELLKVHKKGKRNYGPHLWILLNLSLWYDFWIKKEDIRKKYNL